MISTFGAGCSDLVVVNKEEDSDPINSGDQATHLRRARPEVTSLQRK